MPVTLDFDILGFNPENSEINLKVFISSLIDYRSV